VSGRQNLQSIIKVADNKLQLYNYETEMKKHEFMQLSQEVSVKDI
jgi:hypothetical protein